MTHSAYGSNTRQKLLRHYLFLLCLLLATPLWAYTGQATDEAFAALLSMPGAEPENGKWVFEVPEDFEVGNEDKLIRYLGQKKKQGADFNAYRHFGTLLHHAIRANQLKTARWLLANGADPRKPVQYAKNDALALSMQYQRAALTSLLQSQYGMSAPPAKHAPTPPPRATLASAAAAKASPSFKTDADIAVARAVLQDAASASNYGFGPDYEKKAVAVLDQWQAYAAPIPADAYARILDDDTAMGLLVQMLGKTPQRLQVALARLPAAVVQRHGSSAIAALSMTAALSFSDDAAPSMRYSIAPDSWRTLWRLLGKPTAYPDAFPLAGRVQAELWPELLASGYVLRDTESELGCMPARMGARDFKALWPLLEKTFLDIRRVAPKLVAAPYRLRTNDNGCWHGDEAQTIEKLHFLAAKGVTAPINAIRNGQRESLSPEMLAALKPFLPPPGTVAQPRLVDRKLHCTFTLNDVWYRALLGDASGATVSSGYERTKVDTVQLVDMPGQAECALVVGGWGRVESYPSGLVDNFTGPNYEPNPSCPDPMDRYEVWQQKDGRIVRLNTDLGGDDGNPYLIPVQDRVTGRAYYVHTGEQYGRCHSRGRAPFAFEWQQVKGEWALLQVAQPAYLQSALLDQCSTEGEGMQCHGIAALQPGSAPATTLTDGTLRTWRDAFQPVNWLALVNLLRAEQHQAYQAAITALDKPALKALQAEGIPGQWTAQAMTSISDSDLSLADKRKRAAWIFYDHRQLERALLSQEFNFDKLATWLPREDWHPLFAIFAEHPYMYVPFGSMRTAAQEKGHTDLACDLDHVRSLMCGETIEGQ